MRGRSRAESDGRCGRSGSMRSISSALPSWLDPVFSVDAAVSPDPGSSWQVFVLVDGSLGAAECRRCARHEAGFVRCHLQGSMRRCRPNPSNRPSS